MSAAITVSNISKMYRLGQLYEKLNFREVIMMSLVNPLRKKKRNKETLWALKDINFEVNRGQVLGIIGRNGAGKSTLLKVLSKITYPTEGTISVNGRIASLLEVGTGFHEELTGRENIFLNGAILGMTKKEIISTIDAIISFAGVEKFVDTPIKRYSSGMRLRLGFAVAAHLNPDILLIDEVLAVGDAEFQKKCLNAMKDLHSVGRTVLFVSHNMSAIENLCRRVIWIDEGKIRMDGPAQEVIKSYLASFSGVDQNAKDLQNIKSRGGTGIMQFKAMEILNADGSEKPIICSGDNVKIRLHYKAFKSVSNPHFGMEIYSDLGTMITSFSTWSTGDDIPKIDKGDGFIELDIDFLNFMPSRYYITLWVGKKSVLYDHLEHCASIDVEPSDFYRTGKGIESRFGLVFLSYRWNLNHNNPKSVPSALKTM